MNSVSQRGALCYTANMSRNLGITHGPRVLFVTTVASTLEAFLLPYARALRADGARVDALAADALSVAGLEGEFDQRFEIGWSRSLRCLAHYLRLARELRALVARERYDVIWTHTPLASIITRAALRHQRQTMPGSTATDMPAPRVVYTAHGFHFYRSHRRRPSFRQGAYRVLERIALRWTDVMVVMNDEDEVAASRWFASPRRRCELVRIDGIGIDSAAWAPLVPDDARCEELRTRYQIPMGSFVVTQIAEMNANKRHELLIEAAALLQRAQSLPWMRLVLVGQGPLENKLRALVEARGLTGVVIFTGQLSTTQLRELLTLTNIGLLVSEREGLPRSLMEMCAAGIPIAGTRTRGVVDEVADSRALASAPTPQALADLIEELAKNSSLRAELAHNQYARLEERYDLRHILPRYLELLR